MNRRVLSDCLSKIIRRSALGALWAITSGACVNAAAEGFPAPTGIGLTAASGDQTTLYGVSTYWDSVCGCAPLA